MTLKAPTAIGLLGRIPFTLVPVVIWGIETLVVVFSPSKHTYSLAAAVAPDWLDAALCCQSVSGLQRADRLVK